MSDEDRINHNEIRLIILSRLYEEYYHGGTFTYCETKEIFADLLKHQPDAVAGDLLYLKNKRMIDAMQGLGERLLSATMITEVGIDKYENAMQQASNILRKSDQKIPKDIDSDITACKWNKVGNWFKNNPELVRVFAGFFASFLRAG